MAQDVAIVLHETFYSANHNWLLTLRHIDDKTAEIQETFISFVGVSADRSANVSCRGNSKFLT